MFVVGKAKKQINATMKKADQFNLLMDGNKKTMTSTMTKVHRHHSTPLTSLPGEDRYIMLARQWTMKAEKHANQEQLNYSSRYASLQTTHIQKSEKSTFV
jgi:hypothetical protein